MNDWKLRIKENPAWIICTVIFLALVFFVVPVKVSGDLNSGVYHFLYAKSALSLPEIFLNRWANPLFVLVAFPFAQFGIEGLHFFNAVCALITILLCCNIASKLGMRYTWLCPFLLLLTPVYFVLIPTGLTEVFFALVLIFPVYLFVSEKPASAAFFASLLPFAGIEGIWFLFPMALALVATKKYQFLPNLFFGLLFYSAVGFLFLGNFFWWIGENSPLQNSITFVYYVSHLELMYGIVIEVLLFTGLLFITRSLFIETLQRQKLSSRFLTTKQATEFILILKTFVVFFVMRSVCVGTNAFGTIGADREMAVISPLVVIIALRGLNVLIGYFEKSILKNIVSSFIWLCLIVAGTILYSRNIFPPKVSPEYEVEVQLAAWIKKEKLEKRKIYFNQPSFVLLLNLNPLLKLNSEEAQSLVSPDSLKSGNLLFADNSESSWKNKSCIEQMKINSNFKKLNYFRTEVQGKIIELGVFEKK